MLFHLSNDIWNFTGYCDLNHLTTAVNKHASSHIHLRCILKLKLFGNTPIDLAIDNTKRLAVIKFNEKVSKNREIMRRLIDVICFLGKQELAFRGHDERESSTNRGNYVEFLNLLSEYDPSLSQHLKTSTTFKGTSKTIQNDIINSIGITVLNFIKKEIHSSSFLSILVDETTDISQLSQMSIMFRLVDEDGIIQERFYSFLDVSKDRSASAISTIIINLVNFLDCGNKLVAQSYDGAAVMSGEFNGTQAKVQEKFQYAKFIHCAAHRLNLVLSQSVEFIPACKIFFVTITSLSSYFHTSTKRSILLSEFLNRRFPQTSPTRWNFKSRIIQIVNENRDSLIDLFDDILENSAEYDKFTIEPARGYLHFLHDFESQFLLNIFSKIFVHTDILFDVLQNKSLDILFSINLIKSTMEKILSFRNDFKKVFDETIALVGNPRGRLRGEPNHEVKFLKMFNEISDTIQMQMQVRFKNLSEFRFPELLNKKNFDKFKIAFPVEYFESLKCAYPVFFDFMKLTNELTVFYTSEIIQNSNISSILKYFKENDLCSSFSEISKLCELIMTFPFSTASVERSFSTLKRIKNYSRNSIGEERLSNLSLISIEKSLVQVLKSNSSFYDNVIEEFARKDRRIELTYK